MSLFSGHSAGQINELYAQALENHSVYLEKPFNINMARGVPSAEQLDLSNGLFDHVGYKSQDGTDCRNYMGQQGIKEARELFAPLLGVPSEQVVVDGNSSLAVMHDCIAYSWNFGNPDSPKPWCKEEKVAFLCPTPGYDRHFKICEVYGIELIPVPLNDDGPDIDAVRALAADPKVRGIWCVPKYSNPTGAVYSQAVVEALASMPVAAPDFRVYWDNAYCEHHLTAERIEIANISQLCVESGNPNRALLFSSTSKMTFAGAGLALFGGSKANVEWWLKHASVRSVGPDKLNQLRHVTFLNAIGGLPVLMDKHRAILAPRFQAVHEVFERELGAWGVAEWSSPKGGYFISVNCAPNTAARVVALAKEAGVQLTPAGAAFPYGKDPEDRHLRIAPSSVPLNNISDASLVIANCILIAACEQYLSKR
ncbi:aminotransferase class I/II-fold pyridoxal phosphate-dependent enzyme [Pseudomonas sp. NBRC 111134]|uniref:aminotransferase class I/II-fold pyridoxal phosphate-dependent enzyme n=1 Tax=Pseudomonas sp. NBRC 111134 TaxID=1661049 RepID=UPI00076109F8|nr:aminotransferase class I/II-fold pyridoxal phosphate-dependent enzyme [Pseudomonas sp. NBRC 111134]